MKQEKPKNTFTASVRVRDAIEQDIPHLQMMINALAYHHSDTPQIDTKALKRDIFGKIPWIYVLVAEIGKNVVGYAALCPLIQLQFGSRGMDMHHLFVEEEFRGVGVGKSLIEASMQKARNLACIYMTVGTHADNTDAQAVYLACGFEVRHGSSTRFGISLEL